MGKRTDPTSPLSFTIPPPPPPPSPANTLILIPKDLFSQAARERERERIRNEFALSPICILLPSNLLVWDCGTSKMTLLPFPFGEVVGEEMEEEEDKAPPLRDKSRRPSSEREREVGTHTHKEEKFIWRSDGAYGMPKHLISTTQKKKLKPVSHFNAGCHIRKNPLRIPSGSP